MTATMTRTPKKHLTLDDITPAQWDAALARWRQYPIEYVDLLCKTLKVELTTKQREVIEAIFKHKKVLIPTHHAFGKSFICAIVAITIMNLYCDAMQGVTLAPTFRQVQDILWAEMRSIFDKVNGAVGKKFLVGKFNLTRWDYSAESFAVGISPRRAAKGANTPEFIQGQHKGVMFLIGDEAGGLEKQIFEQGEGITNTAGLIFVIYIGNPLNRNSEFGEMCNTEKGEGYITIHIKAYESPNLVANGLTSIEAFRTLAAKLRTLSREERMTWYENKHFKVPCPFLLSPGWAIKSFMKWGESPLFFSKVIGDWVESTDDTLVPLSRMNEVMLGSYIDETGKKIWDSEEKGFCKWNGDKALYSGLDCSGDGADKRVLHTIEGNREFHYKSFAKTWERSDVDGRGTRLKEDGPYIAKYIYDNLITPNPERKQIILIDCTGGFGDSVYDALMKYPLDSHYIKIVKINFASKAQDATLYHDIIAEMAFNLASSITSADGLLLEPNDDLKNQITNRRKRSDEKHRNAIESKREYKGRAGQSPDDFDALMLANRARGVERLNSIKGLNNNEAVNESFESTFNKDIF